MERFSFGFSSKKNSKPVSDLEKQMKAEFVGPDKDPFPDYIGTYVSIPVSGGMIQGRYRGINDRDFLILLPNVCSEFTPNSKTDSLNGEWNYYWETKRPKYIQANSIMGMSPVRKEFLDGMVAGDTLEARKMKQGLDDYSI